MDKQALYRPTEDRTAHGLLRRPVFIPLGRSLIHERPGGCAPSETTQRAKLPKLGLTMYKKERGMASVKKEGTREREWTRESGKKFCVGLVQYGSLDPEAALSFPIGKQTNKQPTLSSKPGIFLVISLYSCKRTWRVNHNATILDTESRKTTMGNSTF